MLDLESMHIFILNLFEIFSYLFTKLSIDDPNERVLLIAQSKLKKKQELLSKELTIQKQKEVDRVRI